MNDIAKRKEDLEKAEGLRRLKSVDMSDDVAEMVFEQLRAYRNVISSQVPSVRASNPVDLIDIEILDSAWAFSAEGINYFRLAVNEAFDPHQYERLAWIGFGLEHALEHNLKFTPEQVTVTVNKHFDAWMREQGELHGVPEEEFSVNLVMGAFYFAYLMAHSYDVGIYEREGGGLTVVFKILRGLKGIDTVRVDYYQDAWEHYQK